MELWIRTKYYKIVQVNFIGLRNRDGLYYEIIGFRPNLEESLVLGAYKTEKRALEVLDEIQKLLMGNIFVVKNVDVSNANYQNQLIKAGAIIDNLYILDEKEKNRMLNRSCIVFEMPEE